MCVGVEDVETAGRGFLVWKDFRFTKALSFLLLPALSWLVGLPYGFVHLCMCSFSGSHQTYFIKSVIMKIFSCLSWMEHLYDQVFELFVAKTPVDRDLPYGIMVPNTVTDRELPYELIVDILSRLPAECVVPCVHACKPLVDLTRTQSFIDLHLERASPVIAFQYFVLDEERGIKKYAREVSVTFTDKTLQKVANSKTITVDLSLGIHKKECRPTLYGSYNGFLMFKNIAYDPVLFLWNPATQEQVTITAPHDGYHARGLFFHPTFKEYRALFVSSAKDGTVFEYSILGLKTKRSRLVTISKYCPSGTLPPAIVNGKLHWLIYDKSYRTNGALARCTHSIVVFDMESEKVSTMGHPGISCQTLYRVHRMMKLMEKDGKLWFVNDMKTYGKISMWMLEDYKSRIWVRMPDIELKKPSTLFCGPCCDCKKHEYPEALHIFKNEVLIRVFYQDLYLYSLQGVDENKKMRRVEMQFNDSGLPLTAVAHVGTLLSLRTDKLLFLFKNKT